MTGDEFQSIFTAWSSSGYWDNRLAQYAVLGSGAEIHVSGHSDDFSSMSARPDVALHGIDGAIAKGNPIAYRGWFRKNNLGISSGVYYPGLGNERVISAGQLVKDGWHISLKNPRSQMHNKRRRQALELDTSGK